MSLDKPPSSVLRVITRLNIGGPAIQALLLTRALRDSYPTILAAGTPPAGEGELSDPEVHATRLPLVRQIRPVTDIAAYRAIRHLIDCSGVGLVHTHMAKAGILGRLAAHHSTSGVKTVHTFHGHVLDGYFTAPMQRLFIAIERGLARRTDALVAVSDEVRDSLLSLGIGSSERFHVIPLGFELAPFLAVTGRTGALRDALQLLPDVPLIGVAGRLAAIKDHDTLLRAMTQLPQAHLVILGDGEKRRDLERIMRRLDLERRVHLVGWRSDMAECLADVDVMALTSRNEGTPVSLIEASAAARPVVATDVGGVASVVVDGKTGFLARAGDDAGIAHGLRMLMDDRSLAARLGAAGRDHVRERFTHTRLVSDVEKLYDSLIGYPPIGGAVRR